MVYIKVNNKWYTSDAQSPLELSRFTYNKCQLIFDNETNEVQGVGVFDDTTGLWDSKFLNLTVEQVKLEIFLQKENFIEWNEQLESDWPYWDNYNA